MRQVELLAPVGKLENAYAAIENGADAIFVGTKLFNARQFADNFSNKELEEIIVYCKLRDVRVYITVNTLIKNEEIEEMFNYLGYLDTLKIDGIIIQDFAVVRLVKKYFPHIIIHGSTQLSAHSTNDVAYLKAADFKRIVLARELTIDEVKTIKETTQIEVETFVHGALCYAYSGQCLMSSLIGGRSGNRGRCAQPCRMTYQLVKDGEIITDEAHWLSLKDICTLPIIDELIEVNIDSFKIEGRMKSPEYVASVVSVYRKYIDQVLSSQKLTIDQTDVEDIKAIFNRGGFSTGYYKDKASIEMLTKKTPKHIGIKIGHVVDYNPKTKMAKIYTNKVLVPGDGLEIWNTKAHTGAGVSKPYQKGEIFSIKVNGYAEKQSDVYLSKSHEVLKKLKKSYQKPTRKVPISLTLTAQVGQPIKLTLQQDQYKVTVISEMLLQQAENQPVTKEQVKKQMMKFGSTSFEVTKSEISWPQDCYISIKELNVLRREATIKLEDAILHKESTPIPVYHSPEAVLEEDRYYSVEVTSWEQLEGVLGYEEVGRIYWQWTTDYITTKQAMLKTKQLGKKFYIVLPHIMRNKQWELYQEHLQTFIVEALDGFVCRTYGQVAFAKARGKEVVIDYSMNVMNNEALAYWQEEGADTVTVTPELTAKELQSFTSSVEKIIYGHLPVMTTAQCLLRQTGGCQKQQQSGYALKDRKDTLWRVMTDCTSCTMQLLTQDPIWILPEKLQKTAVTGYRIRFTDEKREKVEDVLEAIFNAKTLAYGALDTAFSKKID